MKYIGCSGFLYDHWKERFYPTTIPKNKWFQYYVEKFTTVELNVTFYRLPKAETVIRWRNITPDDFAFSIKGSRYISHLKRLKDVPDAVERFFHSAHELGGKLAVVLWQFPPQFSIDLQRLKEFIFLLKQYKRRNAFEFRHESWICTDVEELLREAGYCFCMADWPEFLRGLPVTSDYIYIRRHGHGGQYDTLFSETELKKDRDMIKKYERKGIRDVFLYFNNDYMAYAPKNALILKKLMKC